MKLLSLETTNFKKLGSRKIDFTDGVNFIVGDNGQGKSTVLRAVAVAKFGVTMLPGVADDIPTRGTDTWSVKLRFEHLGTVYDVVRGKSAAYVSVAGEKQANGQSATTAYLEDLLNISAKDYNLLLHSRQGETNYVITYGATALQRKVEEFAGISELDKIVSMASTKSRDEKAKVEWISAQLPSKEDEAAHYAAITAAKDLSKKTGTELSALESKPEPAQPPAPAFSLSEERTKLRKYFTFLRDTDAYRVDSARLRAEIADLPSPIEVPVAGNLTSKIKELQQQLKDLREYEQERQRQVQRKGLLVESLRDLAEENWDDEYPALLQKASQTAAAFHLYSQEADRVVEQAKTLQDTLGNQKTNLKKQLDEGVCSSCGTELHQDVADLQKQIEEVEAQWEEARLSCNARASEAEAERRDYTAACEKLSDLKEKNEKVQKLQKQIASIVIEEAVESNEDELQAEIHQARSESNRISELQEEADALEVKRSRLVRRLATLEEPESVEPVTEADLEAKEAEQSAYEVAKANWTREVENHARDLQEKRAEWSRLLKEIESLESRSKEIEDRKATVNELVESSEVADKLAKYLRERRSTYLVAVWDSIMAVSSEFLDRATQGAMTEVAIDSGKFMFREDGAWVPAIETSGAQAAFLGTALRIGLNKALYRGDTFLAFDEPTEAMTEENSRNLVASISGAADQIFLVSHKQTDQALASNIIEV